MTIKNCDEDCFHCRLPDCASSGRTRAMQPAGKRFGDRLRTARMKIGMSQKQLADYLGTYGGTVCRWEFNDCRPSEEYYEKLLALFPELKTR